MRRFQPAIAGLLLATGLAFSAAAPSQTVSLAQDGKQVTIAIGDAARLPAEFPDDVYVPEAARLQRVDHARGGLTLHFALDARPDAVAADYATAMTAAGWRRARVVEIPGVQVQAWEHDSRAVVVAAQAAEDGSTRLQLELRGGRHTRSH